MLINISPQSRQFCFAFTVSWLVVITSVFVYRATLRQTDGTAYTISDSPNPRRSCQLRYFGSDQCQFVLDHCSGIDNLVPYLRWYFCAASSVRAGLLVALLLWLLIIFAAMATAADSFLAVNLASLVHSLKISESLAGVTIFAFGNGSSDLFSTLAAMNGGNASLAIAELFGAAAFITTVVLGAIAVIQPFQVNRRFFLGDVVCFLVAASVNLVLIADGKLELWESLVTISLYVCFVAYVLIRDRKEGLDTVSDSPDSEAGSRDAGDTLAGGEETTALLLHKPPACVSLLLNGNEPSPANQPSKTSVVEQVAEINDSQAGESSSLQDGAFEYEHVADVPPFIRLCSAVASLQSDGVLSFILTLLRLPAILLVGLTTITQSEIEHSQTPARTGSEGSQGTSTLRAPQRHPKEYGLLCAQLVLGPQFTTWVFWSQLGNFSLQSLGIVCAAVFCSSLLFVFFNRAALLHPGPYLHIFLSTTGFITATVWIYVLASEAVALIESLGVISDINDVLLGATVFAIGNSSNDIFANLSVARRGHPVLASAACLGSPMLNTLLGIGFGSLVQIVKGHYRPYVFHVPASLLVSAASLLTGLSVVLFYVLLRQGQLDKYLGYSLMTIWTGFAVANVYVSMNGS